MTRPIVAAPSLFFVCHVGLLAVAVVGFGGCKKDPPASAGGAAAGGAGGAGGAAPAPPPSAPPKAGTDADNKRIEALDLAVKIDGELATLERGEKVLADGRKVEAWITRTTPPLPKKMVVATVDDKGATTGALDLYYDDKGLLTFARAADGLFVFRMESLSVWLDNDQKVKQGLTPGVVKPRVDAITGDSRAALTLFGLR